MTQQIKPKYIKVQGQGAILVGDANSNGSSLPIGDAEKVLVSDGTTLAYQYPSIKVAKAIINFDSLSTVNLGTPMLVGARIQQINVEVVSAFNSPSPAIEIGIVGDVDQLATHHETNLKVAGRYTIFVTKEYLLNEQVIVTYSSSGATSGQAIIEMIYTLP